MRSYEFAEFGLSRLQLKDVAEPVVEPGHVLIDMEALSLNYRDILVMSGHYNPKLPLPATPISDGAGIISEVGEGVEGFAVGDRVVGNFVAGWEEGPFLGSYLGTTLGTPGPGMAQEKVLLPASSVVKVPDSFDAAQAATLPIAALTAWSALVTEGQVIAGNRVLTLGTGGVSIFALQLAKAMGAEVIITSSSDEKLERAKELGADHVINYRTQPRWENRVLELTEGIGVDVVVENGGVQTLSQSLKAVKPGGTVALLGALTGLSGEVQIGPILMKRIHVAGVMVDSKKSFASMLTFMQKHRIEPVIDVHFKFEQMDRALQHMKAGKHFGKIIVDVKPSA